MKKNILNALYTYLNGDTTTDLTEAREYINTEYLKQVNASKAKADAYAAAKPIVLEAIHDTAMTVKDIFEAVSDRLPEGFGQAKVQYGLLHYWNDEVVKTDNGKAANTYKARG